MSNSFDADIAASPLLKRGAVGNWSFSHTNWPEGIFQFCCPSVSVATTRDEMRAIARLRYKLYIARDEKPYRTADHAKRLFEDPIDGLSLNFMSSRGADLLAAVRLTRGRDALDDPQTALVTEASSAIDLEVMSVTSRLVVQPTLSARRSIIPLFQEIYRCGLELGIEHNFLATRLELRGIFERFGFRMTGRCFSDPVAGLLHVFRLDLNDHGYLAQIRSPLVEPIGDRTNANS